MARSIVASLLLAFLSAASAQMQMTETLYKGGSCTGIATASATLPMATCVAVSTAYREAWGWGSPPDPMSAYMVMFHLDNSLQYCTASTELLCETAMRDVVTSWIASDYSGASPAVATYPNTASAFCASYEATAAELVSGGMCWSADNDEWECPLAGCRIKYELAEAPPPASPTLITESLYRDDCDGTPAVTFTTASGECEAAPSEYREAWSNFPDEWNPKDDPIGAYSGFSRDAISGVVTWCWGSTQVACESGFAGAPYGTDTYLDARPTQLCGDYRASEGVDVCWAEEDDYCAFTNCHGKITTVAGSPAPPPPPPSPSLPTCECTAEAGAADADWEENCAELCSPALRAGRLVGGVLIAVIVAPIVGIALLVVLIIVCVCCCCKKKPAATKPSATVAA